MNGTDNLTTVKMTIERGYMNVQSAYAILKKYWDPRVADNVRNMKLMKDGFGAVFDIKAEKWEGFYDNFERLLET